MAAICAIPQVVDLRENVYHPQRIPILSRVGLGDKVRELGAQVYLRNNPGFYAHGAEWRYHTAILEEEGKAFKTGSTSTRTQNYLDALAEASALVAVLLKQITIIPTTPYRESPPTYEVDDLPLPYASTDDLARARKTGQSSLHPERSSRCSRSLRPRSTMPLQIDFDDTSGYITRGKAAKKKKAAQAAKWSGEGEEKKDNASDENNNYGGGNGNNGDGGAAGGSGGDDNGNNGGNDDDNDWNFGSGKKNKKNNKKKQQEEEEEEERRKKEEEAAAAAAASNPDPLSWADEAINASDNDDWTTGFTTAKEKKKKKKGLEDVPPTVPDPPVSSAFQDISLDDAALKLDFSFDAVDSKKSDSGFGNWGKTWDFDSIGLGDKKKDNKTSTTDFADNNPWSLGNKGSKKKTTISSDFDFGNFGAGNDITFGTGDLADTKAADNAWGFSTVNKKDKKNVTDADKKEEPATKQESGNDEFSWGSWGTTAKGKKSSKKESEAKAEPESDPVADAFDWGFSSKKDDKKKGLISEIAEEPALESEKVGVADDDWLNSGAWGTATRKKEKKGKKADTEDLTASIDLTANGDSKTAVNDATGDDIWATFGASSKSKKKNSNDAVSPPPAVPDPPSIHDTDAWGFGKTSKKTKGAPDAVEDKTEPELPWDHGLTPKERRKKKKEMEAEGVSFDMFDKPTYPRISEPGPEPEPEAEPEPASEEPKKPWDFGLSAKEKKRRRKEMEAKGIKFDVFGDPVYPKPEPVAELEREPELELDLVIEEEPKKAWDFGLNTRERKKKKKEMEAEGVKFDAFGEPIYPDPEPVVHPDSGIAEVVTKEPEEPWDFGLTAKEKKKKKRQMQDEGILFDANDQPIYPDPEPEAPLEEAETVKEPELPWDHGLSSKEKKRKKKEMQADGILFDDFDQPIYPEAEATTEAGLEEQLMLEDKEKETEKLWDDGLSPKEKKKKKKEMQAEGIIFNENDQPIYPEDKQLTKAQEVEPEVIKEPDLPWDHGLSAKEKKKKRKEMEADGILFDSFDQPIYPEAEPAIEKQATAPETSKEPELPWDHGLSTKERKKKRKEMEAEGILFDSCDQPIYPKADSIAEAVDAEPEASKESKLPWDHGLSTKEKRKKRKEMEAEGILFDNFDQPIYPETEPVAEGQADEPEASKEPELPWDHGLSTKERKKKRKEMEAEGILFDNFDQPIYPETEPVAEGQADEPDASETPVLPWDHGLSAKEKKKKRKEMEANGILFDNFDQPIYPETEPVAEGQADEPDASETPVLPWDHGLSAKEKKKKRKEMEANGILFDSFDQPIYPDVEPAEEEPEVEPEAPEAPKEPELPWDHGLNSKEKKKKRKEMEAQGIEFDTFGQPVYPDPEPEAIKPEEDLGELNDNDAEEHKEPEEPWDFGLNAREKKKKRKEMETQGIKFDVFGEPIYAKTQHESKSKAGDEVEVPEPPPEPEAGPELPWDHGLSVKDKKKKKKEMESQGIKFDAWGQPILQKKVTEPELEVKEEQEIQDDNEWDTWGGTIKEKKGKEKEPELKAKDEDTWGIWGLSSKDKKKSDPPKKSATELDEETNKEDTWGVWGKSSKNKDKDMAKKDKDITKKSVTELISDAEPELEKSDLKDDLWGSWGLTSKEKKKKDEKDSKKGGLTSPVEDTVAEKADAEDEIWGAFSSSKDKKSSKSKAKAESASLVTSPSAEDKKSKSKTANDDVTDLLGDDNWAALEPTTSKTKGIPVEEKKSSIWGFGATTLTSKSKKDAKARKEADEKAEKETAEAEEERLRVEAEEAEAAAKLAKKTKSGKLSKTPKESKDEVQVDLLDELVPTPKTTTSKISKTTPKSADKVGATKSSTDDYFGVWDSGATSKKTAGKKDNGSKKEITKKGLANDIDALMEPENDLEHLTEDKATSPGSKSNKTMPDKTKVGSSIAERMKALGVEGKTSKGSKVSASKTKVAEDTQEVAALDTAPSPKEDKKASKTSVTSKTTSNKSSKNKEDKAPLSPLPGSFPGAFGDDDDLLGDDIDKKGDSGSEAELEPAPAASKSKSPSKSKGVKKTVKSTSKSVKSPPPTDHQSEDAKPEDDLLDLDSSKLASPPPEEKRLAKKERARVERTGNTTGWGFWSATPPPKKKESVSKKKESETASPPPETKKTKSAQGFVRPKPGRSTSEKEKEEPKSASKSSESDKESASKKPEKMKPSRGMSFSQFMLGGPPPSAMRTKSSRRSSTKDASRSSSRRGSLEPDLASPPPEEEKAVSDKAAKLIGARGESARKKSSKTKSQVYADPYPIDDDDMVMINTTTKDDTTAENQKAVKSKSSAPTRRASTKPRSKTISGDEEIVMVDGPGATDAIFSGNEDVVHVDSPARLQRSSSVKKTAGFFGSFFGARRSAAEPAQLTDAEDTALPIRTRSSSRRKGVKALDDGGFTTDAPIETDGDNAKKGTSRKSTRDSRRQVEDDERAARDRRRKERRDREQADLEARRARAEEQARRQQEAEDHEKQERRERRRQKEAERRRQEELEADAAAEGRREERRRLRAKLEAQSVEPIVSREDRQRSYKREESDRERRRERRRIEDPTRSRDRQSSALVEEYHETRSGRGKGTAPPANKTSSWIDSQQEEPPEIPMVEGTIIDPSGQKPRSAEDVDSSSRRRRNPKYDGMTAAEIEESRARRRARREREEKSHSGGSDERERRRATRDYDNYGDLVRTFDGRPSMMRSDSKRSSFLTKWF